MKRKLRFAIVGCGRIAQRHAEHIEKVGELVAVCDIVESKAVQLSEKYNSNLENWYDSNYDEDIAKLHQNLSLFDDKIKLFNISNALVIN
jgi:predicted dehydrogenase